MDGTALIFCEGALGTLQGKTANGLVRFGNRYQVLGVIDSRHAGREAREIVEGAAPRIPVFADLDRAMVVLGRRPDYLVIGLSPDDGRLPPRFRHVIIDALKLGLSVDSALQPYLHKDAEFPMLAMQGPARLRSIGYPKPLSQLKSYTGQIVSVAARKVVVVGTTNPVGGKNVTTFRLAEALRERGVRTEIIGTSEAAWFQGLRYALILDSIIHSYVSGELEAVIVQADQEQHPQVLVIEGQGSIINPAHPTGIELLTTAQPDAIVMQHAPLHESIPAHDKFGLATLERHIRAAEILAGCPVVMVSLSHHGDDAHRCAEAAALIRSSCGLPVTDILAEGPESLADVIHSRLSPDASPGLRVTACLGRAIADT